MKFDFIKEFTELENSYESMNYVDQSSEVNRIYNNLLDLPCTFNISTEDIVLETAKDKNYSMDKQLSKIRRKLPSLKVADQYLPPCDYSKDFYNFYIVLFDNSNKYFASKLNKMGQGGGRWSHATMALDWQLNSLTDMLNKRVVNEQGEKSFIRRNIDIMGEGFCRRITVFRAILTKREFEIARRFFAYCYINGTDFVYDNNIIKRLVINFVTFNVSERTRIDNFNTDKKIVDMFELKKAICSTFVMMALAISSDRYKSIIENFEKRMDSITPEDIAHLQEVEQIAEVLKTHKSNLEIIEKLKDYQKRYGAFPN